MQSDIRSFVLLKYNITLIGLTWLDLYSLYPKEVIEKTQTRTWVMPYPMESVREILIEELCEWETNHVVIG